MNKKILAAAIVAGASFAATPAFAQDSKPAEFYVGGQIGYHDLGGNPIGDDDGFIYGTYVGVDVPVGEVLVLGLEGNFNLGTNAIDSEYGIAGKIGANIGEQGQLFLRGGYQEVNFDVSNVSGGIVTGGIDDTDGDYLLGVGGQYKINDNLSLRVVVDTISFDTTRVTSGLAFHF